MANTPVRQYIGARYVPLFADPAEWDNTKTYEPLTIVLHEGNSYTSRQYVPTGIDINNNAYWALTGNYNAQVEAYRQTAQNALKLAQTNQSNIAGIDANLEALHADSVDNATIIYNANAMDISKLGCKKDDPNFDNAPIINNFINTTHKAIYIPDGKWYIQTTLNTQDNNIYADGWIKAAPTNNFTNNTMVYALGSTELITSAKMPKGKKIHINIDGSHYNIDGITIQGFFNAEINATVIECMNTAVKTQGRNVECKFHLALYGGLDSQYAECGLKVAKDDNDNYAYVIGRNFNIGIDLPASIWTFQYIHIWGCNNVMKLYPITKNYVYLLYADYSYNGALICDSTERSAELYCGNIFAILTPKQYFIGTPDGTMNYVRVIAESYKANLIDKSDNRAQSASFMKISRSSTTLLIQSQIKNFGFGYNQIITSNDLNTLTETELINKYGPIYFHQNLQQITFEKYNEFTTWEDFKTTQYYKNMIALGYTLPSNLTGTGGYHYGRTYMTIEKSSTYTRTINKLNFYTIPVTLGTNIKGYYDSEAKYYTYTRTPA